MTTEDTFDEREPVADEPSVEDPFDEREPTVDEPPVVPPAPPPPPGQPLAERGVSAGNLTCAVCRRPIPEGETYIKGAARGATHEEPCSHQA